MRSEQLEPAIDGPSLVQDQLDPLGMLALVGTIGVATAALVGTIQSLRLR